MQADIIEEHLKRICKQITYSKQKQISCTVYNVGKKIALHLYAGKYI